MVLESGLEAASSTLPAAGAPGAAPTTLLPPPPSLWPLSLSQVGSLPSRPTWATRHLLSSAAQVQQGIPAASSWASQDQRDVLCALPGFHCASSTSEPPHLGVGGFPGNEPRCQCRRYERLGLILGSGRPLEEGIASHSSSLAWRIPRTEEPGRLQSVGSQSRAGLKQLSTH